MSFRNNFKAMLYPLIWILPVIVLGGIAFIIAQCVGANS